MRRAEDRAKLSQKKPRLREAEADRPQSQRGIGRNARQTVQSLFVFVGAEIERTYRDRFAVHSVRDRAIRLELLVLRREARAIEEQKFGAEKSYAGGAVFQRLLEIVRKLDVRLQFDADAVDRFRRLRPQALQLLPRDIELVLLQPIFGQHGAVRIDDDDVVRAVNDQQLAVADQLSRVMRRDNRRHIKASRDDRGV